MPSIKENILETVEELRFGHPETRKAAAIKLGRIRDEQVIPYLIETIEKDDYMWARVSAIQSLGWIADNKCIPALISCAKVDKEDFVRKTAITTLGALRDNRAIGVLAELVSDEEESDEIRNASSLAIEIIKGITPDYSQAM